MKNCHLACFLALVLASGASSAFAQTQAGAPAALNPDEKIAYELDRERANAAKTKKPGNGIFLIDAVVGGNLGCQ